jgi:hypothetical protein
MHISYAQCTLDMHIPVSACIRLYLHVSWLIGAVSSAYVHVCRTHTCQHRCRYIHTCIALRQCIASRQCICVSTKNGQIKFNQYGKTNRLRKMDKSNLISMVKQIVVDLFVGLIEHVKQYTKKWI